MFDIKKYYELLNNTSATKEEVIAASRNLAFSYEKMRAALGREVWASCAHGRERDDQIRVLKKKLRELQK